MKKYIVTLSGLHEQKRNDAAAVMFLRQAAGCGLREAKQLLDDVKNGVDVVLYDVSPEHLESLDSVFITETTVLE